MASKKSVRGSGKGYRVLVLTRKGKGKTSFSVSRVGRLVPGLTTEEVLAILKKLAPKKTTTAVAVTKTGTIHLAARAKKRGGKDKTSQRVARVAATTKGKVQLMRRPTDGRVVHSKSATKAALSSWKNMPLGSHLMVKGTTARVLKPGKKTSAKKKPKKTSKK
jgi:hypothetical protein